MSHFLSNSIVALLIASFTLPSVSAAYDSDTYAKNMAHYSAEYQTAHTALENRMNDRFSQLSSEQQNRFLISVKNILKKRVAKIERQSEEKFQKRTAKKLRFIQRVVAKKSVEDLNLEQDETYTEAEKRESDSAFGTLSYLVGTSGSQVSAPTSSTASIQLTKSEFVDQARAVIAKIERSEIPDVDTDLYGDLFTLKLIVILLFIAIPVILLVVAILTSALGWWIAAGIYIGLLAVIYFTSGDKRRDPDPFAPNVTY